MKNIRDKLLIAFFCGILSAAAISAPLKYILTQRGIVYTENVGNIIEPDRVFEEGTPFSGILNCAETAKRDVKDIYTNYLPGYIPINTAANRISRSVNAPVSDAILKAGNTLSARNETVLPSSAVPVPKPEIEVSSIEGTTAERAEDFPEDTVKTEIPESPYTNCAKVSYVSNDQSYRYYSISSRPSEALEKLEMFVRVPVRPAEELHEKMLKVAERYNRIQESYDVNFYIFAATTFHDTKACEEVLPTEAKNDMFQEFFDLLNKDIQYGYIEINNIEDMWNKYWATDIHWNQRGYAEAYEKITGLFRENYEDIVTYEPNFYQFDDVHYFGSHALALSNYNLYDIFGVAMYELPEHRFVKEKSIGSCSQIPPEENLEIYLNGNFNRFQSYSHYMQFFRIGHEINYPENHTGRNLLLFCDSFSPPLQEAIAAHFDNTYIRYTGTNSYTPPNVGIDYYIENCGVTDVMILEMSDRILYDYYKDCLKNLKLP